LRSKTDTKETAILDAAARIFSRRSFHEVLIDDVAAEAGTGKGTIYRYFRTKDELYLAAVVRGFSSLNDLLDQALATEASPSRRLELLASETLKFFWAHRHLIRLLYRLEARFERQQSSIGQQRERLVSLVERTLADGIMIQEFRPFDPRIGAELFVGMIRSVNLYRHEGDPPDALLSEMLAVFTTGIVRPPLAFPTHRILSPAPRRRKALRA